MVRLLFPFCFFSPLIAFGFQAAVLALGAQSLQSRYAVWMLVLLSVTCGFICAALTLVATVERMHSYEIRTGLSSGNAPLVWIFFYGPLSFAAGEMIALLFWWLWFSGVRGPNGTPRGD